MTDRPILFSASMVLALLREARQPGTGKTQTRRILKPQPVFLASVNDHQAPTLNARMEIDGTWSVYDGDDRAPQSEPLNVHFEKGDRLWVRESFSFERACEGIKPRDVPIFAHKWYWADGNPTDGDWTKPIVSIHMPRWTSRLTLTVTDVRVERLQAISEADCLAEGPPEIDRSPSTLRLHGGPMVCPDPAKSWITATPRLWYRELWDAINGAGAWDANPWVVATTFTVAQRNIDAEPVAYLIWSNVHGAWWGPKSAGYFTTLELAGRYTREEAVDICSSCRDGYTFRRPPTEIPIREIDAVNARGRPVADLLLPADHAECRRRDLARKGKAA